LSANIIKVDFIILLQIFLCENFINFVHKVSNS
jgi:hypothetical protein